MLVEAVAVLDEVLLEAEPAPPVVEAVLVCAPPAPLVLDEVPVDVPLDAATITSEAHAASSKAESGPRVAGIVYGLRPCSFVLFTYGVPSKLQPVMQVPSSAHIGLGRISLRERARRCDVCIGGAPGPRHPRTKNLHPHVMTNQNEVPTSEPASIFLFDPP